MPQEQRADHARAIAPGPAADKHPGACVRQGVQKFSHEMRKDSPVKPPGGRRIAYQETHLTEFGICAVFGERIGHTNPWGVNDSGLRNTVAVPGAPGQRPLPHWTSAGWQSTQIPCVERPCCMAACALPREFQPGGAGSGFGPRMLAESCPFESIWRIVQSHHLPGRVEHFPKVSRECRASPNRHRKPQKMV